MQHRGAGSGTLATPEGADPAGRRPAITIRPAPTVNPWWRPRWAPLLALAALALALRLWGINAGLPWINRYFYETDEAAVINIAMAFGAGDLNPHTAFNPPFFMYQLFALYGGFYAVGRLLGWFHSALDFAWLYSTGAAPFYLVGRLLAVVYGAATVALLVRLGARLYGRWAGLAAGLLLALAPLHATYSQMVKVDVPAAFWALAAVWFAVSVQRGAGWRAWALAGACAGLAAATKYQAGIALLALPVAHWQALWRGRRRPVAVAGRPGGLVAQLNSLSWGACLRPVGSLGLGLACCLLAFAATAPYLLLDWRTSLASLSAQWRYTSVFYPQFAPSRPDALWLPPHFDELRLSQSLGWPLLLAIVAGVAWALWRRRAADWLLLAPVLGLYTFMSLPPNRDTPDRYLMPAAPLAVLLAARLLSDVRGPSSRHLADGAWRRRLALVATLCLAGFSGAWLVENDFLISQATTTTEARSWIEAHLPPGSRILIDRRLVPQLTFTPEALRRAQAAQDVAFSRELLASRRDTLDIGSERRGALAQLKDRALLEAGVPYDLYVLRDSREQVLVDDYFKAGWAAVRERVRPQYLVLSSGAFDMYFPDRVNRYNWQQADARRFYEEVFASLTPWVRFRPRPLTRPGPEILIYRLDAE